MDNKELDVRIYDGWSSEEWGIYGGWLFGDFAKFKMIAVYPGVYDCKLINNPDNHGLIVVDDLGVVEYTESMTLQEYFDSLKG